MNEDQEFQREMAVCLFNEVWELLEKPDRTPEESDRMIHAAHASRYHWGLAGTAVNLARGEWQISHVYAVLNRPEPAIYHAQRSLEICQKNDLVDFDLAYAYEAMARAAVIGGNSGVSETYLRLAREAGDQILDPEDQAQFLNDLSTVPGYEKIVILPGGKIV